MNTESTPELPSTKFRINLPIDGGLPEGVYRVLITSIKPEVYHGKNCLLTQMQVVEGDYNNRKFTVVNQLDGPGAYFTKKMVDALDLLLEDEEYDWKDLVGKETFVRATHKKSKNANRVFVNYQVLSENEIPVEVRNVQ